MIYTVFFEVYSQPKEIILQTCFKSAYTSPKLVLKNFRAVCEKTFPKLEIGVHRVISGADSYIDTVIGTPQYHSMQDYNSLYLGWNKSLMYVESWFYVESSEIISSIWSTWKERLFASGHALYGKYTIYHFAFPLRIKKEQTDALLETIKRLSLVETAMCNTELATQSLRISTDLDWQYNSTFVPMQIGDTGQMKVPGGLEWWVELKGEPKRCKMRLTWLPRGRAELTEVSLFGGGSVEYSPEGGFDLEIIII